MKARPEATAASCAAIASLVKGPPGIPSCQGEVSRPIACLMNARISSRIAASTAANLRAHASSSGDGSGIGKRLSKYATRIVPAQKLHGNASDEERRGIGDDLVRVVTKAEATHRERGSRGEARVVGPQRAVHPNLALAVSVPARVDTERPAAAEGHADADDVVADEQLQTGNTTGEIEKQPYRPIGKHDLPRQLPSGGARREGEVELDVCADDVVETRIERIFEAVTGPDGKAQLVPRRRRRDDEDWRVDTVRAGPGVEISGIGVQKLMLERRTPNDSHRLLGAERDITAESNDLEGI